ncbi:MAG TPA: hypothetical protein VIG78_00670, partial [Gemmatimonadaceae bacterium]
SEPPRDSEGDKSLAHPNVVTQKRSIELVESEQQSMNGRNLVAVKLHLPKSVLWPWLAKNQLRDS